MLRSWYGISAFLLPIVLLGCNGENTTAPGGYAGMAVTDMTREPIIWQSESVKGRYDTKTGITSIVIPWPFRDTARADDIAISYLDMLGIGYQVWNTRDSTWVVFAYSSVYEYFAYRRVVSLYSLADDIPSTFIDKFGRILLKSPHDINASVSLLRYRASFDVVRLNRKGSNGDVYFDDIELAADSDGLWVGWSHEVETDIYGNPIGISYPDTLAKLNASGERMELWTSPAGSVDDIAVYDNSLLILTNSSPNCITRLTAGVETGRFSLDSMAGFECIVALDSQLWVTQLLYDSTRLIRVELDASFASGVCTPTDTVTFPGWVSNPQWDGESLVYYGWRQGVGSGVIRLDTSGYLLSITRTRVAYVGEICRTMGSYWTLHYGSISAQTRGPMLSRVSF